MLSPKVHLQRPKHAEFGPEQLAKAGVKVMQGELDVASVHGLDYLPLLDAASPLLDSSRLRPSQQRQSEILRHGLAAINAFNELDSAVLSNWEEHDFSGAYAVSGLQKSSSLFLRTGRIGWHADRHDMFDRSPHPTLEGPLTMSFRFDSALGAQRQFFTAKAHGQLKMTGGPCSREEIIAHEEGIGLDYLPSPKLDSKTVLGIDQKPGSAVIFRSAPTTILHRVEIGLDRAGQSPAAAVLAYLMVPNS